MLQMSIQMKRTRIYSPWLGNRNVQGRQVRPCTAKSDHNFFISVRFFDIDTKFQFFCDIPVASSNLYTKSSFCMKIMGDAINIRWLRNSLSAFLHGNFVFVCPGHLPLANWIVSSLRSQSHKPLFLTLPEQNICIPASAKIGNMVHARDSFALLEFEVIRY